MYRIINPVNPANLKSAALSANPRSRLSRPHPAPSAREWGGWGVIVCGEAGFA
ncbi:MAG: hypothetical protein WC568_02405 [Candidatus Methanoperedens sp.]